MSAPRWRLAALVGEATRNVVAAPVGALLLVAVIALCVGAGTVLEGNEARRARTHLVAQITDGGWVTVARSGPGIDADACRRLARQHDVLGAGGLGKPTTVALSSAPGTLFPAYDATAELFDVLAAHGAAPSAGGVVGVGAALARELGLVDGSHVVVEPRSSFTVAVLPTSLRTERFGRALIRPVVLRTVQECWVEWAPGTPDVRHLTESLLAASTPLDVASTLSSGPYVTDPFAQFARRWTRWWFVAVGAAAALVLRVAQRSRSRPLALYAAMGSDRAEVATLFGVEAAMVATAGAVVGALWGLALFTARGDVTAFDLASAVRGALFVASFVTLVTIVAVAARRRQLAAQLKAE